MRTSVEKKLAALSLASAVTTLTVGLLFAGGAAYAAAAENAESEAEAAIRQGTDLRRAGDDRAALVEFQKAVRLKETPRAFAQLGLAEQALGLWLDAQAHVSRALAAGGDPWIEKNRATLQAARMTIQSHLAQIEVWGSPKGAQVRFDGVLAGTLPSTTAWVVPGEISMVVTAPGHSPLTRLLSIPAPTRSREHAQLRPLAAAIALPPQPIEGEAMTPSVVAPSASPPDVQPSAQPVYKRWWFWAGVGALAVGTGVSAYLLTRDTSEPTTMCTPPPCNKL